MFVCKLYTINPPFEEFIVNICIDPSGSLPSIFKKTRSQANHHPLSGDRREIPKVVKWPMCNICTIHILSKPFWRSRQNGSYRWREKIKSFTFRWSLRRLGLPVGYDIWILGNSILGKIKIFFCFSKVIVSFWWLYWHWLCSNVTRFRNIWLSCSLVFVSLLSKPQRSCRSRHSIFFSKTFVVHVDIIISDFFLFGFWKSLKLFSCFRIHNSKNRG